MHDSIVSCKVLANVFDLEPAKVKTILGIINGVFFHTPGIRNGVDIVDMNENRGASRGRVQPAVHRAVAAQHPRLERLLHRASMSSRAVARFAAAATIGG
eukprot:SAG31_NODE_12147_length_964_cov_1.301734_1_plen_100_part_00